jgi:hypothetical protein
MVDKISLSSQINSEGKQNLRDILDAADRRIDEGAGISHDQFWQEVASSHGAPKAKGRGKKRLTNR